jgi:putative DNA methylase
MNAPDQATPQNEVCALPRAIEVGFPIVEINRLAEPERNSFKPIYQMHKWFARRASCVFRAILLGALKPAVQPDGTQTDLMAEFYRNHADDPDTRGKIVLDPFMGGGTTVVESLRLGCKAIGVDLNPVAWFIVKTEIEPVELAALEDAFERLAERPVAWNGGKALRDTLLDLYRTEAAPGVEADVIYTFWVKHAICTDQSCGKEVPLFKDYIVAHKTMTIRYWRDIECPVCHKAFDWETQPATLVAEKSLMTNAPRGSAGEGRPTAAWLYAAEPPRPRRKRDLAYAQLDCPCCASAVKLAVPSSRKKDRKKVPLTVLLCPACEAVWQWRGTLPDGLVSCPSCRHSYDPRSGNVPENGKFQCACGNRDSIIQSIRQLPKEKRLPVRPYAIQAYLPARDPDTAEDASGDGVQISLFGDGADRQNTLELRRVSKRVRLPEGCLLPENGKFFKRFSVSDKARLTEAEELWDYHKETLPYPKTQIPAGYNTNQMLKHNYRSWHEMFSQRQLLALSTLLYAVMQEHDPKLQELLLCAFSDCVGRNNFFCRYFNDRNTIQEIFSRHDYQPKITIAEGSIFGSEDVRGTYPQLFSRMAQGKRYGTAAFDWRRDENAEPTQIFIDSTVNGAQAKLHCGDSTDAIGLITEHPQVAITDPPYVGNVNYSELADFYYVWQRLALKERYPWFAPETTPKAREIVQNEIRGKSEADFFTGLGAVFSRIYRRLPIGGLLVFTFHHTDQEGRIWEGLLRAICETGYEIAAVYPIHGELESSLHLQDKENASYDLIHVCRKRVEDPAPRSWAGIRQEVRRRARTELAAIEAGRYGGKPLAEPDVRLICIGKCLELYSAHYGHVLDHENKPLPLHRALQDISAIVDQLVTRERPLPAALEDIDSLSYVWLRCLMPRRAEVSVDSLSKELRALQVSIEDVKDAGLVVRGRTGRGRTYKVKQPEERLETALKELAAISARWTQTRLFNDAAAADGLIMADLWQALIALAGAGESVLDLLESFKAQTPEIVAGLRYCQQVRTDWEQPIKRILSVVEGAPLFERQGAP